MSYHLVHKIEQTGKPVFRKEAYPTERRALIKACALLANGAVGVFAITNGYGRIVTNDLEIRNRFKATQMPKNPRNNVVVSFDGRFHAFWNERAVYEGGRIKRFASETEAWEFLAMCDAAGKIIL